MCGIVAAVSNRPVKSFIDRVQKRQLHRGPDGQGSYFRQLSSAYIGLGHQRLSIIDTDERSNQPMRSRSGRYVITFNGEIYNYRELASSFGLKNLRTESDTEVALELIEKIGIDKACRAFNGMWAMILYDEREGKLTLARDRVGKKPLYYKVTTQGIFFASEMHSLLGIYGSELSVDSITVFRFLSQSLQNIDTRSWDSTIKMFPPASITELDCSHGASNIINMREFWRPQLDALGKNTSNNIAEVCETITSAIKSRLNADVPVGIALSGGIDSTIISSVANRNAGSRVNRIRFLSAVDDDGNVDEKHFIDVASSFLKATVDQVSVKNDEDLLSLLNKCTRHSDGPLLSFSSVLFYQLMKAAKDIGISVVLTGQGADEAFCGYRKYPLLEIKRLLKSGRYFDAISFGASFARNGTLLPKFHLYEAKRYWGEKNKNLLGDRFADSPDLEPLAQITSLAERQWSDITKYSVPYMCHYEDRMSMAASVEVRSPFLDYRVLELGMRLNEREKLSTGWTKFVLRRAFQNDLPAEIAWRKDKLGFLNPQDNWLRGPLKNVVMDIMGSSNAHVYTEGFVNNKGYLTAFDQYCTGRGNIWFRDVFAPFALELWIREAKKMKMEVP